MKKDNCIFCKIANGDIPSYTIFEDSDFRVILDIEPAQRGHMLILPKEHCDDITKASKDLSSKILPLASSLGEAAINKLEAAGFNILLNTGKEAGQTVFHCHTHIIPRYANGSNILKWGNVKIEKQEFDKICEDIKAGI